MHPDDDSNRPAEIVQQYWAIYPQFLRDLFVQAFVDGLTSPAPGSPRASGSRRWTGSATACSRCPTCGTTNFWDVAEPDRICRVPQASLRPPFVLQVGRRTVAVGTSATLRSDHLASGVDNPPTWATCASTAEAARWGLPNASGFPWPVSYPDGQSFVLEPDAHHRARRRRADPDRQRRPPRFAARADAAHLG